MQLDIADNTHNSPLPLFTVQRMLHSERKVSLQQGGRAACTLCAVWHVSDTKALPQKLPCFRQHGGK